MSTVDVKIKHAGKSYDVTVDLDQPGLAFKERIHQLTGVEPAKVKVVVKGGMLKVCGGVSLAVAPTHVFLLAYRMTQT